jgi:hypothetical protein
LLDYGKISVMKNSVNKKTNALKFGVIAVLVFSLLTLGFYVRGLMENLPKDVDDDPDVIPAYTVSLDDYKVYQFNDLLFDFIMANITVTSNVDFTLGQDAFTTSENIILINTPEYTDPLTADGYKLQCPNPASETALSKTFCLFIPIINRSLNEVILKVAIDRTYNISFNMNDTAHAGTRTMLGVAEPTKEFIATILDRSLISTKAFYTINNDGDHIEAAFSSNAQVFGFNVTIENNSKKALKVDSAYLVIDGKDTFQMVDPTYLIDDQTNLINTEITSMDTGYLFFNITDDTIDLYSLQNETIHVMVKLSTRDSYVEVSFTETAQ